MRSMQALDIERNVSWEEINWVGITEDRNDWLGL